MRSARGLLQISPPLRKRRKPAPPTETARARHSFLTTLSSLFSPRPALILIDYPAIVRNVGETLTLSYDAIKRFSG